MAEPSHDGGRFSFTWTGKTEALALVRAPSQATLAPCEAESVHFETTGNAFIEGDNLDALKLLFEPYLGRIKLIYIDPPYNTGHDFVYPDDYTDHSAWLSMMIPRLYLARQLLRDDGLLCVSIDDNEVHHLRTLMNEVFGEENYYATVAWQKKDTPSNDAKGMSVTHEYVLLYRRSAAFARNLLPRTEAQIANYKNPDDDPRGAWTRTSLIRKEVRPERLYGVTNPQGRERFPPPGTSWRIPPERFAQYRADDRLWWGRGSDGDLPFLKRFLSEVQRGVVPITWWDYRFAGSNRNAKMEIRGLFDGDAPFDTPKPVLLIKRLLELGTTAGGGHLVLDFFAGSCTTAHAVLELNREDGGDRRFIVVQLPEPTGNAKYPTIADIGKERIRRVAARLAREGGSGALAQRATPEDLGFKVFKLHEKAGA